MPRPLLLTLLLFLSGLSYGQSDIYTLHNMYLAPHGYLRDSVLYDLNGNPTALIKGSAVINTQGVLCGWTDNGGFFFGADGIMSSYTLKAPKDKVKKVILKKHADVPFKSAMLEFSPDFFPIFCYDFLPLDKEEEALRGTIRKQAYDGLDEIKRQENARKIAESYNKIAEMAQEQAQWELTMENTYKNLEQLGYSRQSSRSYSSSISSLDVQQYRQKAQDVMDRESDRKATSFSSPVSSLSNGLVHESKTTTLRADPRIFAAGLAITSRDSIIQQRFRFTSGNKLLSPITIFSYNSSNNNLQKIDHEYNMAYAAFDSAIHYLNKGNNIRAYKFAQLACKSRKSYVNAYYLAYTCARNLKEYDQALMQLDNLDAIVTENQKGALSAAKAEIFYLKDDEATARSYLQEAFDKKALGWVYFMEMKYGMKLSK